MPIRPKQRPLWLVPSLIVLAATLSSAEPRLHDWPGADRGAGAQAVSAAHMIQVGHIQLAPDSSYKVGDRPQLTDLYVDGSHAYVGSFHNVLYIVDISDPANLRQVAQVATANPPVDVKVAGDLAVVGLQTPRLSAGGLLVLDISEPWQPRKLAEINLDHAGGVHNLFVYQQRAYLAHSSPAALRP